jgi:elongation factor G
MAKFKTEDIRNITLVGHGSTGKTTIADALLYIAGGANRMGLVDDGSSVFDFEDDEKDRKSTIDMSLAHFDFNGRRVNVIDTPGYLDFIGEALSSYYAVETALICVDATKGVEVSTRKHWDAAGERGLARAFVITKSDQDYAKVPDVISQLQEVFGSCVAPATVADAQGPEISKVVDLLTGTDLNDEEQAARGVLMEAVVSSDDDLLERYLGDEEIKAEELSSAYAKALIDGSVVPVFVTAARKEIGIKELAEWIVNFAPNPMAYKVQTQPASAEEEPVDHEVTTEGGLRGLVFKVKSDDYVGKLCFFRVVSGSASTPLQMIINGKGKAERVTGFLKSMGKEQNDVSEVICGDILAVAKIDAISFGDTLSDAHCDAFVRPNMPLPMVQLAVEPKSRGDEQKIISSLRKLADEDATFTVLRNDQTNQMVISGMGQLHLDIKIARLEKRFKVGANTKTPKVPYLETITQAVMEVEYTHKKQSGGSGQFGRVIVNMLPAARGEGYEFVDKIFGGSIDQSYRPSVDKGIQNKAKEGLLAGCPVVDFKVELIDGKTHPVDSKDIAFQIAGREVFKKAMMKAKPVLLEPIVNMEVVVPGKFMGDITGDIAGRRGRVQGMDSMGDMQVVKAQVPLSEVQQYSTELRGLTGGEGFYTIELSHYDVVPGNVAQQVIAAAQKDLKDD